jgi:hypothetical protein
MTYTSNTSLHMISSRSLPTHARIWHFDVSQNSLISVKIILFCRTSVSCRHRSYHVELRVVLEQGTRRICTVAAVSKVTTLWRSLVRKRTAVGLKAAAQLLRPNRHTLHYHNTSPHSDWSRGESWNECTSSHENISFFYSSANNYNRLIEITMPSSSSIVSDYGLDDRAIGIRSPAGAKGFFLYPDRLWGPPSLLYNGYRGVLSPGVKRGRGVTLTTHPHLVPRS